MRVSKYLKRNIGDSHSSKHLQKRIFNVTHTHTHTQNTLVPDQLSRKSLWYCTPTYATCTSGSSHVLLPQGIKLKLALKRLSAVTIMWAYCFQWLATDTITPDI